MAGRTVAKYTRVYIAGFDMSGFTRTLGSLDWEFEERTDSAISDEAKNTILGQPTIGISAFNTMLDNAAAVGAHAVLQTADAPRVTTVAIGDRAVPAAGDPIFTGEFLQKSYLGDLDAAHVAVNVGIENTHAIGQTLYNNPWGVLHHALGAETGVNAGTGQDNAAATTAGGYFVYHLTSSSGTVTLSLDDSANNSAFTALSGATSGSIDASATPAAAIVGLGVTATVRQYLRWQLVFGTATTATFVSAFVRGRPQ